MHAPTSEQTHVWLIVGQYVLLPLGIWIAKHVFSDVVRVAVRDEISPLDKKIDKHIEDDEREFKDLKELVTQRGM